ncbi:hypothetical protein ACHAWC_007913 [Mediolabrus comicus]
MNIYKHHIIQLFHGQPKEDVRESCESLELPFRWKCSDKGKVMERYTFGFGGIDTWTWHYLSLPSWRMSSLHRYYLSTEIDISSCSVAQGTLLPSYWTSQTNTVPVASFWQCHGVGSV